jgi:hypothetical protein
MTAIVSTLIVVVVTSTGIVISGDTATSDPRTGQSLGPTTKIERTGMRSGAAINGNISWTGEMSADFEAVFRRVSRDLSRAGNIAVAEQARRFGEAIKEEAERAAKPVIRELLRYRDGEVATVTVVGFEKSQPIALTATVHIDPSQTGTNVRFAVKLETWIPKDCLFFSGSARVANALLQGDSRLAESLTSNRSVQRVRTMARNCEAKVSDDDAIRFVTLAIDATRTHLQLFGYSPNAVSFPVDVLRLFITQPSSLVRLPGPAR